MITINTFEEFMSEGFIGKFISRNKDKTKTPARSFLELTQAQRDLIKKNFKSSNVDIKSNSGEYILPHNAKADHGVVEISFANEDGELVAFVSHFRDKTHSGSPITHTELKVKTDADIAKLKSYGGVQ